MSVTTVPAAQRVAAPFARVPVFVLAGLLGMALLLTAGRFGYLGDELYFLAAGKHLAWGYVDQPPMLPLPARAMDTIAPGSVFVLRLPAMLVMVAAVVFAALFARELGGRAKAQALPAATCGEHALHRVGPLPGHLDAGPVPVDRADLVVSCACSLGAARSAVTAAGAPWRATAACRRRRSAGPCRCRPSRSGAGR